MKSYLRMWQLVLLLPIFLYLGYILDPLTVQGIVTQTLVLFAKASLANIFFYYLMRIVLHTRTHQLSGIAKQHRELTLLIAHSVVTFASISTS